MMTLGPAYDIPKLWSYNNYQYAATTTWIRGRHSLKFGADFLRAQYFSRNVVEVAYAGSKGTHLQRRYDINQAGRSYETRTLRPYPFFGAIQIINDGSNSIYSSGQVTVRRRFSKNLFVRGSYTYAKSIDESSNTGGTIQYNFSSAQDSRNLKLERGRSDFDIGHTFAGSFIWTPVGREQS